ncbi:MAG TPA: lasso RiPP family leader peptide-containing protein [Chloroflexia bacterium]|nr:lasso RiPP family leader peptide-containing protein [Chloroflexia bacterium]
MDPTKMPAEARQPAAPRRPYSPPRLVTHGTVAAITAGLPLGVGYVAP